MKTLIFDNHSKKIEYGCLFPTETIQKIEYKESHFDVEDYFEMAETEIGFKMLFKLEKNACVYGLGENVRGINKRGYKYESFCSDDPVHTPGKKSLYGAHNFFMIKGEKNLGCYIDFAGKISYDIGFTITTDMSIEIEGKDFDVYIYEGQLNEIAKKFRSSIGMSYVPPKWGFGYQQSRWSYETAERVLEIADSFDSNDIPCDAIYLDIDYMERFKDFTVSDERFPNFKAFTQNLLKRDFKLVPIIDAGVKIEEGYSVYEEGLKNNYFCVDKDKKPFVAAVWPGQVHFPDFLNSEARKWFGNKYHSLLDLGIKGFWNDMNEPAIFYSEQGLKEAFTWVKENENKNLDIYSFFELKDKIFGLSNSIKDYKSLYHQVDGKLVNHYDVHNLYGYNMTKAADEGFNHYDSNGRFLLLTRASHIGMAKHSGIWTGDNHAWWEHLKLNIQMMPSLNMAGFLYSGADTGGFQDDVSPELMVRWLQFSIFTPLLRNHSALGTKSQEPWVFETEIKSLIRDTIRLRYAMVPYLYSEFMKAALNDDLIFKPLSFEYEDLQSQKIEDQLLVGDSIMVAPVYEQNATGRTVYLPEKMMMVKIKNFESMDDTCAVIMDQGHHYVNVELDELLIFIRPDRLIVLTEPKNRVNQLNETSLTLIGYVKEKAAYRLYNDDGETKEFKNGGYDYIDISVDSLNNIEHNSDKELVFKKIILKEEAN